MTWHKRCVRHQSYLTAYALASIKPYFKRVINSQSRGFPVVCHVGLKNRLSSSAAVKCHLVNHVYILDVSLTVTPYTETDLDAV